MDCGQRLIVTTDPEVALLLPNGTRARGPPIPALCALIACPYREHRQALDLTLRFNLTLQRQNTLGCRTASRYGHGCVILLSNFEQVAPCAPCAPCSSLTSHST
jgi:hypothetical protein